MNNPRIYKGIREKLGEKSLLVDIWFKSDHQIRYAHYITVPRNTSLIHACKISNSPNTCLKNFKLN